LAERAHLSIVEGAVENGDEVQIGKFRLVFLTSVNEG